MFLTTSHDFALLWSPPAPRKNIAVNILKLWDVNSKQSWAYKLIIWWHTCKIGCAEKQTPLLSLRSMWQSLEPCWHLSSLSGLILSLCSHGVRGKAGVAMATPVDGAIELWERRVEWGAVAADQHHNLSLSILNPSNTASPVSILLVNLCHCCYYDYS